MKRAAGEGFTLVEIMIVVALIGLLSALALPAMLNAGRNARSRRFAAELRTASGAFFQYAAEHGVYPTDKTPGIMPDGMDEYLKTFNWSKETVIGGQWDWDYGVFGITAGVSVKDPKFDDEQMKKIDHIIDDGSLASGAFRSRSGGYMYVLEE